VGMNNLKNRKFIMKIIALSAIGVLLVPTLYAGIYLSSIWDVYGKMDKVPVAFVNLDKMVTKNGKEYAIGNEVEKNIKDNKKVLWKFVDHDEAMNGVNGTEYFAVIEIPEDFSQKVADAQDGKFQNPDIIYIGNKGKNFVFSQVTAKVAESLKTEVCSSIQKEISKVLVDSLNDVKVSIKEAGDGASDLQEGTRKLLDGSEQLASGIEKAVNGSALLQSGLEKAAASTEKLQEGTSKLQNGSNDLANGLEKAAGGSKQLVDGLKAISEGQIKVLKGTSALGDGLNTFKSSMTKANSEMPLLVKGASDVNKNTALIEQGAETLNNSLNTGLTALADGVKQSSEGINQAVSVINNVMDEIDDSNLSQAEKIKLKLAIQTISQISSDMPSKIEIPLRNASNSTKPLVDKLKLLQSGTKQVADGTEQLASGLIESQNKASAGLDQLIDGLNGIQSGNSNLIKGMSTTCDKTTELSNGLDKLSNGANSLKDGLTEVNKGNISLKEGLSTAARKTSELTKGLNELSGGASSLKNGLEDANDGTKKLSDGLNSGYKKLDDKLKFNSDNMSDFISKPVEIKDQTINDVKNYGEGLGPYFISISLWIGVMLLNLIISLLKPLKVFKGKFMNSFTGKLLVGSGLVIIQALLMSFILVNFLKLSPVSIPGFYLCNVFIALVFFGIMYGVSNGLGVLGVPIMFVVLILQLASSGGTFPIETAPAVFRALNKVLPMTYSVGSLRMVMSGINSSLLNHDIFVLLTFMFGCLIFGLLVRSIVNRGKKRLQVIDNAQAA